MFRFSFEYDILQISGANVQNNQKKAEVWAEEFFQNLEAMW